MNGLASSSFQTQKIAFLSPQKGRSEGLFLDKKIPGEPVDFRLQPAIHILKDMHLRLKMKCFGAMLVDPVRRQNFAGKLPIWPLDSTTSETASYVM